MADIKISDLTAATSATGSMQLEVNDSGSSKKITVDQIKSYSVPDGSITSAKIATDAVTASQIATGAVGTNEIADASVTGIKIADAVITAAKLAATTGSGSVVLASEGALTSPAVTTPTLTGTKETKVAIPAAAIDLSLGNYFTKTISTTTTFTVSNVPSSGTAVSFVLDLTNGGSATVNWWTGVKWASGTAPALTSSGRDILGFFTHDGGTTWNGLVLAKDIK